MMHCSADCNQQQVTRCCDTAFDGYNLCIGLNSILHICKQFDVGFGSGMANMG